jgi:uncharacterized protein
VTRIPRKPLAQIDLSTIGSFVLSSDETERLNSGLALFNSGKFWEAHEVWETIWQLRSEDGRFFIQGLIQLAAGYHQLRRRIYRGFLIHLKQAEERLSLFPSDFLGIDVAALRKVVQGTLTQVEGKPAEEVDWSAVQIAQIRRV